MGLRRRIDVGFAAALGVSLSMCGGGLRTSDAPDVGPADATPLPGPADAAKLPGPTMTLTAAPFVLAVGEEVHLCEVFPNPFGGVETDIVSMTGTMSEGSRSFYLYSMTDAATEAEPPQGTLGACAAGGLEFHPFAFFSQSPTWTVTYPPAADGSPMGYPLAGGPVMIAVDFQNTGSVPITLSVGVDLQAAAPGAVHTHAGHIYLFQSQSSVPPDATAQDPTPLTATWNGAPGVLPASYSIFRSWSHMHRTGLAFTASAGSSTFYTESNWDSPGLFTHMPGFKEPATATGALSPVQMTDTSSITWNCAYFNDTGATLPLGGSALANVQCVYIGDYFPANVASPDVISPFN